MRTPFRLPAVTLVLVAALAVSGCTPDRPAPVPSVSQSGTPLFASDEEALAAAEEAYAAYLAVVDGVLANGGADIERLASVAVGDQLVADKKEIEEAARLGLHSTGTTTFDSLTLQRYELHEFHPAVVAYLCQDVTSVDVLDSSGRSVVDSTRSNRIRYEVSFDASSVDLAPALLVSNQVLWGDGQC